jgi:hypothetical protein
VPCVLQKFKEYVNGSNLITKLQAKHDLLKQTLGEGESGVRGTMYPTGSSGGPGATKLLKLETLSTWQDET